MSFDKEVMARSQRLEARWERTRKRIVRYSLVLCPVLGVVLSWSLGNFSGQEIFSFAAISFIGMYSVRLG